MQREIEIGPITTDWYRPWSEERPLVNNLQLGRVRVMTAFYGKEIINFCRKSIAGTTFSKDEAEAINSCFLNSSKKIYNLPERTDQQEFYLQQHKAALAVIRYFGKVVPELAGEWELKDEIADLSDRPSDLLRLLARSPESIDMVLSHEAYRHAALIYQVGMVNARTLNGRLRTVLSDINRLLNGELFEGPEGHGGKIFLESLHDDETNQVIGFPDCNDRRPLTAHLKHIPMTVRKTQEFGTVRTSSRKKDDSVAIVKSWVKALNNGGTVHIDEAVQDSIGREYVLMDDSVSLEQFADKVISIIKSGAESDDWEIPQIVKIQKDDEANQDHGQSLEPSFNVRRKIWFENIPTPIELKFSDRETYLNSLLEVGTRDPGTGLHMGRSHDLFELRRARRVVRVPFPEEIYPVSDYVVNSAFVNRSKQVAYGLRNMYKE